MSTLQTLAAMGLIGYLGFVFISESFNPFKKPLLSELRSRKRFGIVIGLLLAACGGVAFFVTNNTFLAKFKASLGVATIVVALAVIAVAIRQFFGWLAHRRHNKAALKQASNQLPGQTQNETEVSERVSEPVTATTTSSAIASGNSVDAKADLGKNFPDMSTPLPEVDSVSATSASAVVSAGSSDKDLSFDPTTVKATDKSVSGELVNDISATIETKHVNPQPIDEYTQDVIEGSTDDLAMDNANDLLTEQSSISEYNELHVEDRFLGTGPIDDNEGTAANHNLFEHYTPGTDTRPANDDSLVVADDLFDDIAEVTEVTEVTEITEVAEVTGVTQTVPLPDDDTATGKWPEVEGSDIANGDAIMSLQSAMQEVSSEAAQIQDSVNQINTLNRKETYYRTRVEQAQAAYEQAQLAQHESQSMELELGERRLEQEIEARLTIENQLEDKLAELEQTQSRVRTLQADLNQRQQVFSDQVSSLEKTKAMARDAALLARRAATAQQKARTEALKERAARERLEVSAKKAVHIARSAITKLAEEERRNRN